MIKAVIVGCMDYCFQEQISNLIKYHKLKYGDYDFILIQGGAGNFDQLESHLNTCKKLHNPAKIILSVHEDCGYKAKKEDLIKLYEICKKIFDNKIPIITEYLTLK